VNGVWLFPYADHHYFAFSAPAADKTDCCVIFERMEIGYSIHVYVNLTAIRAAPLPSTLLFFTPFLQNFARHAMFGSPFITVEAICRHSRANRSRSAATGSPKYRSAAMSHISAWARKRSAILLRSNIAVTVRLRDGRNNR
jgi:hypothetical protein